MDFEKNVPNWEATGSEPPESLKTSGFQAGYKPPAAYFNWFWSGVSACLTEIRAKLSGHADNKSNPHGVTKTQVGLGNVDNTADSAKPVSTAQATAIADAKKAGTDAQTNLNTHTANKSNPHSVTKSQVGLGNVPNVATNDQTPTYTQASTLATLTSGEKLSVSMGKITKAITDLIAHIGNKSNPHGVTAAQVGAAASSHNHAATEITSGTLDSELLPVVPIEKGGTGTTGWHQALTNLKAMERQAVYYSATAAPDIDTLTDSVMLIPYEYSKNCPVGGGFVYIMQVFYADTTASSNRTQIAFPYDGAGSGIATRSYNNGTWSEWNKLASSDDYQIKTYASLAEIGLTAGSETIAAIATALDSKSELICSTGDANAAIYPGTYGVLRVTCMDVSRVRFQWTAKDVCNEYVGTYCSSNSTPWTGWKKVYNEAYPPTPAEIGITAGTTDLTAGTSTLASGKFYAVY